MARVAKATNIEAILEQCDRLWERASDARMYGDEMQATACENRIKTLTSKLKRRHDAVSIFRMMAH